MNPVSDAFRRRARKRADQCFFHSYINNPPGGIVGRSWTVMHATNKIHYINDNLPPSFPPNSGWTLQGENNEADFDVTGGGTLTPIVVDAEGAVVDQPPSEVIYVLLKSDDYFDTNIDPSYNTNVWETVKITDNGVVVQWNLRAL